MLFFFSNRLGAGKSILLSIALSIVLILILTAL